MEFQNQKGFSLCELLVVLAIFIIVVIAISSLHLMTQQAYQKGQDLAEVNQNGRVILERMTREIRQAKELVTELPDALDSEIPPQATDSCEFEDGHGPEPYHYIRYFKQDKEAKREVKRYYFASNPDEFLPWNATSSEEDLVATTTEGPETTGEYVLDLKFWGSPVINIFLTLEKNDKKIDLNTKIFGRNL